MSELLTDGHGYLSKSSQELIIPLPSSAHCLFPFDKEEVSSLFLFIELKENPLENRKSECNLHESYPKR